MLRPDAGLKTRRKAKRVGLSAAEALDRRGRSRANKDLRRPSDNSMLIPTSGESVGPSSYGSVFASSSGTTS